MRRLPFDRRVLAALTLALVLSACTGGGGGGPVDDVQGDGITADCGTECRGDEDVVDPPDQLTDDGTGLETRGLDSLPPDTTAPSCTPPDCDDDDPCTEDQCLDGFGCQHLPRTCDDGDLCTADSCDSETGECFNEAISCDDENLCTEEVCEPSSGCIYTPIQCDDGDPCTSNGCAPDGGCVYTETDCADGNPCTDDWCDPVAGCQHQAVADPECCATNQDCEDGSPCTEDACVAASCVHVEVPGMVCCEIDMDCGDDNDCTDDICIEQVCNYFAAGDGCCEEALDCYDEDGCTQDLCVDFHCVLEPIPSCCHGDEDCDDGEACSEDICSMTGGDFGFCQNTMIPDCCHDDVMECDDGDVCTEDACPGMGEVCLHDPIDGCCNGPSDCDDGDECTLELCMSHECSWSDICCQSDEDCDDGDDVCTEDLCVEGFCQINATGAPGCCEVPLFEDDFSTNKGWMLDGEWERGVATESTGSVYNNDPGMDHTGSDDNYIAGVVIGGLADTDIHGFDYLTSPVVSVNTPGDVYLSYWRWLNSDYSPYMVNTVEVYNGSSWVTLWESGPSPGVQEGEWTFHEWDITVHANPDMRVRFGFEIGSGGVFSISSWNLDDVKITRNEAPLCCSWDSDCDIGDPEVPALCEAGTCAAGECQVDAECDDEDPCTEDLCAMNMCIHDDIPDCCVLDEDCDDDDICTEDTCEAGICDNAPIDDCCYADEDCDDGDPCTEDTCDAGTCVSVEIVDCCVDDQACDDGDPCTTDTCVAEVCEYEDVPDCCLVNDDCDDNDECTKDSCEENVCEHMDIAGCGDSATYTADVQPIFLSRCNGCHTHVESLTDCSGGTCFASFYAANLPISNTCSGKVVAECTLERIQSGTMPPSGTPPTLDEQNVIQSWIDAGFPE